MVFMGKDSEGTSRKETTGIGVGEDGDERGQSVRQRLVTSMSNGQFYASTGVTITGVVVEGDQITVETADAERMWASIDKGEVIAREEGGSITFRVPARATYARVTCSRGPSIDTSLPLEEAEHIIDGEQFAWTQVCLSMPGRHSRAFTRELTNSSITAVLGERGGRTPKCGSSSHAHGDRLAAPPEDWYQETGTRNLSRGG